MENLAISKLTDKEIVNGSGSAFADAAMHQIRPKHWRARAGIVSRYPESGYLPFGKYQIIGLFDRQGGPDSADGKPFPAGLRIPA